MWLSILQIVATDQTKKNITGVLFPWFLPAHKNHGQARGFKPPPRLWAARIAQGAMYGEWEIQMPHVEFGA